MKLFKKLVLPISCLGHFWHALKIIASNNKMFSVCFFIVYMSICIEKNQNSTCIFLLEIPLIEQSRGLIGKDY